MTNGYFEKLNKEMISLRNILIDKLVDAKDNFNIWIP